MGRYIYNAAQDSLLADITNILSKNIQIGAGSPVVSAYLYEGHQGSSYANPHAATSIGGVTLAYDQNGNLTQHGSSEYAWDAANRLVSATVGGTATTFGYGPGTARLSMTSGGTTTYFPSRTFTQVGSDPAGIEKRIFADGLLVGTIRDTGLNAARHAVFTDHLGGSSVITDIFGDVSERIDYFPFGTARIDEKAEGFNERRKFAGHEYDVESGLSYMKARYYDSSTGRFLSQDPAFLAVGDSQRVKQSTKLDQEQYLANPQHLNSYSYAFNNPLVNVDETGEFSARTLAVGALQFGKAALGGGLTVFQATASGMAYGAGYPQLGTVMAVGALSNLDGSFVDTSNGLANVIDGLFTEKNPVTTGQGPIRDVVQNTMGDTQVFDGVALGANVLTFTGKEAPEYLSKTGAAYKIFQNAELSKLLCW